MKALIICSVHALCDFAKLERIACNRACAQHGIPAMLTVQDHAQILATTRMLEFLSHLPGSIGQRRALIDSYLDILNDELWSTSMRAHHSVLDALSNPQCYARPTGFLSDYPLLTTNLVRSSALLTKATKLGTLTALSDPCKVPGITASLMASATSLKVAHHEIDVLVAHRRDFVAAQSIGMHPRYVEELRPNMQTRQKRRMPKADIPISPIINSMSFQTDLEASF